MLNGKENALLDADSSKYDQVAPNFSTYSTMFVCLQMGWAALHVAAHKGFDPIVRELLARGARPNLQDKVGGWHRDSCMHTLN